MSAEQTVRAFLTAIGGHEPARAVSFLSRDFEFRDAEGTFRADRAAVLDALEWDAAVEGRLEIESLSGNGNVVRARLRESNRLAELLGLGPWHLEATFRVEEGLIHEEIVHQVDQEAESVTVRFSRALEPVARWAWRTRPDQAAEIFEDLRISNYDGPTARRLLSLLEEYATAALAPTEHLAKRRALEAATETNDHGRVVELARELSEAQPRDPGLWYQLGRSAFVLDRHELAMEASERAWDLGHRYMPWIALRTARSAAALDRDEEAFAWLERALDRGLEDRQRMAEHEELHKYRDRPRFRALAGLAAPGETRTEGIVADVDLLVAEARRLHPDYARLAPELEPAAERLKARAPELTDRELLFEISRLVARLGDGHSVVYGPLEDSPLAVPADTLPVLFYLFEEGLYVVDGTGEGSELVGRRVLRIGRRTPDELLEHSRGLHGADNPMTMRWLGVHFYFPRVGFLLDADAIDDPRRVRLEVVDDTGERESVVLETGDHEFPRKLRPPKRGRGEPPRYLRHVDTAYRLEVLEDSRAIYFPFNQVRDAEDEPIAAFAKRLREALESGKARDLIVDLRHNNGGNNGLLRPLLREIVAFDTREETRVWVITGRNTFSAAQNFVTRLERWTDAVFVGEPSSASPNFIGEETELVLPWSRIQVSVSSRYWQDSDPGDDRPWIVPEIPVPPTARDYFGGRDAALEAILSVISKARQDATVSTR